MFKLSKVNNSNDKVKRRLVNRLRNTTDSELIRWIDNIHSGIGKNIVEMRRSLSHSDADQASFCMDDIRNGAVSLLAAIQVLEERFNPEQDW